MKSAVLALWSKTEPALAAAARQQAGRLFLWLPVAFGAGAAIYLTLRFEPAWLWLTPLLIAAGVCTGLLRRLNFSLHLYNFTLFLAVFILGMAVCKLRAEHVRAPIMDSTKSEYQVEAYVVDNVSPSADQPRLLLAPVAIRGVAQADLPLRLRVSLRPGVIEATGIKPGDAISAFAILNPPPAPFMPGGYDFARSAYFQGIGGVGLMPGQPKVIAPPPCNRQLTRVMRLNRLRWDISERLVATITPEFSDGRAMGGFAAALVTGVQAFVPQTMIQDMRNSGLAHILSISGVHMAVVGGFVFYALRGAMALIPWLALRAPIKKISAGLSILAVLIYLAIAGSPAPAVRAAVVACVAFGAILLDRRALSLRALAIAAFIVIALTPEAVIQPGFQMSFSATAALLALSETVKPQISELSVPLWVKALQASLRNVWLSLVASAAATAATTPFAIAYFNRFTLYGLFSNLFEAPITGFIVMPALAIGTVTAATPVGWLALRLAAVGLWLIDRIAAISAALPYAVVSWPSAPGFVLPLSFAGVIWMCLIRGPARWTGLIVAASILWWPRVPAPDVWVDPEGGNAAVRTGDSAYALRDKRVYGFEQWTQHYGLKAEDETARDADYECAGYACTPLPNAKLRIGFWFSNKPPPELVLLTLCLNSDLVVLRSQQDAWPADCAGVNHVAATDFRHLGALELTRENDHWNLKAAQPLRGERYWSRTSDAEGSDADDQ